MAERKHTHGLTLSRTGTATIVDIGDMEIWDGADLSLIRDTLTRLIVKDRKRSIAVQMRTVKYVPSGFFGMLYDWHEGGITIRLLTPQPNVANMIWFRRFFSEERSGQFVLRDDIRTYQQMLAEAERFDAIDWESDAAEDDLPLKQA